MSESGCFIWVVKGSVGGGQSLTWVRRDRQRWKFFFLELFNCPVIGLLEESCLGLTQRTVNERLCVQNMR